MARIQTPQHVQELQAEFKVRESFGLELIETIQPTYVLGSQKVASQGYPRKCFGACVGAAPGVGTNLECSLRCPPDVGIIILLETISISNLAGAVQLRASDGVAMTPIVAGAQLGKQFRDSRINPAQQPDGVLETSNPLTAAPNGTLISTAAVEADNTQLVTVNVVLGGTGYFLVRHLTANALMTVGFMWTEFLLEDR